MFCPKCAAQNADDAKYCRACGADISLVPQAITGHLAERLAADEGRGAKHGRRHRGTPSVDHAVRQMFMGLAFIFVAFSVLFFVPAGRHWWFWMLLPAFGMLGSGVGAYMRVREDQRRLAPPAFTPAPAAINAPPRGADLPPRRDTEELLQPPASVTEGTTRHLGVPAERPKRDA